MPGRGSWGLGTGSAPEGGGRETGCPGQWARPQGDGVQGALDNIGFVFWVVVWSKELDSMILMHPFQVRVFCDSVRKEVWMFGIRV